MIMLSVMISFASSIGSKLVNTYDLAIVKEWLNSYPYLYKGFTPNKGQIAKDVIFYSRNGNMGIFITENGMSYVIYDVEKKETSKDKDLLPHIEEKPENSILHYARIDYELIGGKIKKENIIYQDELPGYENFYLAHCPDGILFVKSYRKVIIKDIYPGINWIFRYDDNGNFHHEFELKDPQLISQIKLKVKYADIELADNGKSIILSTPIGKIKDGSLVGYQGNNIVEVSYRLIDNNLIAFDIKNFDKDKSLLIDPYALVWSTCYGGIFGSKANYVITDTQGNIFITGSTASFDFPVYDPGGGAYFDGTCDVSDCESGEAFILKFTNSGVRLWATYYGGSKWDEGSSITTDVNGNVFVTGYTSSTDFPTYNPGGGAYFQGSNAGYFDAFILKFNNSGVRLWATYYGGSSDDVGGSSYDVGSSITTDEQGNVFVTGTTRSTDFPTYNPGDGAYFDGTCGTDGNCNYNYNDIFILKFNNSGVRLWATYYGGSNWECYTSRCHIATDGNNNLFVTGHTDSNDFPTYDPQDGTYFDGTCGNDGNCNEDIFGYHSDAFILKFDSLGKRLWATYYGGVNFDYANFIAIDKKNNVYIVGNTNSIDFPIQNPGNGAYFDNTCCSYSCYDPPIFAITFLKLLFQNLNIMVF